MTSAVLMVAMSLYTQQPKKMIHPNKKSANHRCAWKKGGGEIYYILRKAGNEALSTDTQKNHKIKNKILMMIA
ncbi:MAG: hypothetical protein ACKE51_00765 [Methylococcaceae bacterium]